MAVTIITKYPRVGSELDYPNGRSWANLNNIKFLDNTVTSSNRSSTGETNYLIGSDFGFDIPTGATIKGIILTVGCWSNRTPASVSPNIYSAYDLVVSLVKGGTVSGANKAYAAALLWDSTPGSARFYGGVTDLWGLTLTAADINNPSFGCAVAAFVNFAPGANRRFVSNYAYIDYYSLAVYYLPPSSDTITNTNPYAGRKLSGKIITSTIIPKVRINGVLIDNKAHEMLMQPVKVLITTKTTYQQSKGK